MPEIDLTNPRFRVVRRGPKNPLGPLLGLRAIREAVEKSQTEVAKACEIAQADVSRLEQRDDVKLSTLRRYVKALGGELDLVVTLPTGHRMRIDL
jgi:DNA-binding Xre family transcriptional regulator